MSRLALAAVVLVAGCASVRREAAVVEGRTAGGIAYDVRGSGPTVVLIHGGVLDRRMWDADVEAFARRFRVVRYDLRGHGRSPDMKEPFSPVDDLAAVLDGVGARRAHLVGLSLGSRVALDFALTHPKRVDRLVLVGPFPSGAQVTEMPPGLDSLMAAAQRGDVNRAAALAAGMPAFAAPPAKAEWVRGLVMANARLFGQSPTAERQMTPPAMARLADVRVPTLVVVGDKESRDILVAADSLARGIRGATRVVVPGAGHLVNVWAPEVFRRIVMDFLAGRAAVGQSHSRLSSRSRAARRVSSRSRAAGRVSSRSREAAVGIYSPGIVGGSVAAGSRSRQALRACGMTDDGNRGRGTTAVDLRASGTTLAAALHSPPSTLRPRPS